jgi:hypothetical protein
MYQECVLNYSLFCKSYFNFIAVLYNYCLQNLFSERLGLQIIF